MGAWRARKMVLGLAGVGLAASYVEVSTTTPRCGAPAATGAHVLYNATFAHSTGETRELQDHFVLLHEVVGGTAIGDELAGACAGDVREWGGRDDAFPEPFRHMSHWNGAKVVVTVKHVTSFDDFVLIETLQNRSFDLASKLINEDRVGVNAVDPHGASALVVAVQMRQKILTASLLNAYSPRCDVNFATPTGYTALHFAVGQEDRMISKALLRRGADPNAQIKQKDSGGWSALHFACRFGNLDIVQDLLDFDADPMLLGFAGETAFQVAEEAAVSYTTRKKLADLMNAALEKRAGASDEAHGGEL